MTERAYQTTKEKITIARRLIDQGHGFASMTEKIQIESLDNTAAKSDLRLLRQIEVINNLFDSAYESEIFKDKESPDSKRHNALRIFYCLRAQGVSNVSFPTLEELKLHALEMEKIEQDLARRYSIKRSLAPVY
jgi:hypothetical protein